jgi:hypothetical protein
MARALHMQERRVEAAERASYLASLPLRKTRAAAVEAHFWVFEHAGEPGRFMEFTEAKREADLAALVGAMAASDSWGEVQGG